MKPPRAQSRFAGIALTVCCFVFGAGVPAQASFPPVRTSDWAERELVDMSMETRGVRVIGFRPDALVELDEHGKPGSTPLDEFLALRSNRLVPIITPPLDEGSVIIETIDGQRLMLMLGISSDPDSITGELDGAGPVTIPLDRIVRIAFDGSFGAWAHDEPTEDTIHLANGDTLAGFVERIAESVLIEADGQPIDIPRTSIRTIRLANPPADPPALLVELADGSVLAGVSLASGADGLVDLVLDTHAMTGRPPSESADSPMSRRVYLRDIAGLVRTPPGHRLIALASIEPEGIEPTGERRWTPEPAVVGGARPARSAWPAVLFDGPMRAEYRLPAGAARFATTASVRPGRWADCELAIEALDRSGQVLANWSGRLFAGQPSAAINLEIPAAARSLAVQINAGNHGPIQDRVTLHRPVVLVER